MYSLPFAPRTNLAHKEFLYKYIYIYIKSEPSNAHPTLSHILTHETLTPPYPTKLN
jgi:hypothetical protein